MEPCKVACKYVWLYVTDASSIFMSGLLLRFFALVLVFVGSITSDTSSMLECRKRVSWTVGDGRLECISTQLDSSTPRLLRTLVQAPSSSLLWSFPLSFLRANKYFLRLLSSRVTSLCSLTLENEYDRAAVGRAWRHTGLEISKGESKAVIFLSHYSRSSCLHAGVLVACIPWMQGSYGNASQPRPPRSACTVSFRYHVQNREWEIW